MNVRVSIINYANTIPFVYGLERSNYIVKNSDFYFHYPAQALQALQDDLVDISILPIAGLPKLSNPKIISDFCIGAQRKVDSVLLCSHVPLKKIKKIRLDYQSRTSNQLLQILIRDVWKIYPRLLPGAPEFDYNYEDEARVIIGDRALIEHSEYEHVFDLAEAWYDAYNISFVFACWVANKDLSEEYIKEFNAALRYGVNNIEGSIRAHHSKFEFDIHDYLTNKIGFHLTDERKRSKDLFLEKSATMNFFE